MVDTASTQPQHMSDETGTDQTFSVVNSAGKSQVLLVCEHASNHIPDTYNGLGLSEDVRTSHIAWDPGAYEVAHLMAEQLDAVLLQQNVSRLVYDCNRPPEVLSSVPSRSEVFEVPGNKALTQKERDDRANRFYFPFKTALTAQLDAYYDKKLSPILVTIHTFTPTYFGKKRDVEIGILHDVDARFANVVSGALKAHSKMNVLENEPYGPIDGVTHTLAEHALPRDIYNVMIEIRNDLVATPEGQAKIAKLLCEAIEDAAYLFQQEWRG